MPLKSCSLITDLCILGSSICVQLILHRLFSLLLRISYLLYIRARIWIHTFPAISEFNEREWISNSALSFPILSLYPLHLKPMFVIEGWTYVSFFLFKFLFCWMYIQLNSIVVELLIRKTSQQEQCRYRGIWCHFRNMLFCRAHLSAFWVYRRIAGMWPFV